MSRPWRTIANHISQAEQCLNDAPGCSADDALAITAMASVHIELARFYTEHGDPGNWPEAQTAGPR